MSLRYHSIWLLGLVLILGTIPAVEQRTSPPPESKTGNRRILFDGYPSKELQNEIYTIDVDTGEIRDLTNRPEVDHNASWSPDGSQIAFSSNSVEKGNDFAIYVMDANGKNLSKIADGAVFGTYPSWSPDGSQIAFTREDNKNSIMVVNRDGTDLHEFYTGGSLLRSPLWSPDGSQIAFFYLNDGAIYSVRSDDGSVSNLSGIRPNDYPAGDVSFNWSLDGKQIVFMSGRDRKYQIYVMNADGSDVRRLTDSESCDIVPKWTLDGKQIIFGSNRGGQYDIYSMNADGSNVFQLTNDSAYESFWTMSPDGNEVAFATDGDGIFGAETIRIMNLDGTNIREFKNDPYQFPPVYNLSWQPDLGQAINQTRHVYIYGAHDCGINY